MNIKTFQNSLLGWYQKSARNLPWRRTNNPYAIWVSEIMLQQTQVQTVIPYYEKWLKRFPTLASLAKADSSEVLSHWAGLGYYRRARMLHAASQKIMSEYKGRFPNTVETILSLPGIGHYTAGAIASIAFKIPAPILDGNVIRVLSRVFAIKKSVALPQTLKLLWDKAKSVVPQKQPGDFNQAMMELGALICTPQNPACLICPVQKFCSAYKEGKQEVYPIKEKEESQKKLRHFAWIVQRKNKFLLFQQPDNARWGGMWLLPVSENLPPLTFKQKRLGSLKHGYTNHQIQLDAFKISESDFDKHDWKPAGFLKSTGWKSAKNQKWVELSKIGSLAIPAPHQKIIRQWIPK